MFDTDASTYAIGAALFQKQDDDNPTQWATIGFWSKTLSQCKVNYSTTERECVSVVWAVERLRQFLEGTHFIVRSDNDALKWKMNLADPYGWLRRWRLSLAEFDFEVKYLPGRVHEVPDSLPRMDNPSNPTHDVEPYLP